MISPIIICDGMIRSGSTWSFNVCRCLGLLLAKRRTQSFGTAYLWQQTLDDFFRTRVNLGDGPMVIKAHEVGPVALEWIRAGRAKAVCTIRDPRDCVASDIHYWKAGFDASVQRVNVSLQSLHKSYQDFGRTIFVRYEEMMADPLWQIRRIAVDLGIEVNQAEVQWVHAQTNIQVSQKICRELRDRPQNQVNIEPTGLRCDPVSLLHENHIDSGKVGRWKMDLTPEQGQTLTGMFSISLRALGYEGGEEAISPLHGFIPADTHATNISAAPLT